MLGGWIVSCAFSFALGAIVATLITAGKWPADIVRRRRLEAEIKEARAEIEAMIEAMKED